MTNKNKMKTAAAMGMLKLYNVNKTKRYNHEENFYIQADNPQEAQRIWDKHVEATLEDPGALTPGVYRYWRKVRDTDWEMECGDYDDGSVKEEKFEKDNALHIEVLNDMYPDGKQDTLDQDCEPNDKGIKVLKGRAG